MIFGHGKNKKEAICVNADGLFLQKWSKLHCRMKKESDPYQKNLHYI